MKARENSFQKVLEELKTGIDIKIKDFVDNSQELKEFIKFRRRHFYSYSVRNSILIYKQNPLASFVAGYKKWEELGYYVSEKTLKKNRRNYTYMDINTVMYLIYPRQKQEKMQW